MIAAFFYQTIDSGLFYEKILKRISLNKNIKFYKNTENLNIQNSIIFNSIPPKSNSELSLWQHFKGVEIKTEKNIFDDEIFNLVIKGKMFIFFILFLLQKIRH